MITIQIDVSKTESVKLAAFRREMIPAMLRGVDKGSATLEGEVKRQLSLGGRVPGRTKTQRGRGEKYVRNPGVHLRIGTGSLRNSWRMLPAVATSGAVEGRVAVDGPGQPYARIHEYGGFAGRGLATFIPMRPYRGPALRAKRDAIVDAIVSEILKPLRGAT